MIVIVPESFLFRGHNTTVDGCPADQSVDDEDEVAGRLEINNNSDTTLNCDFIS